MEANGLTARGLPQPGTTDFLFTNQEWDLYYTQLHILDYAYYTFWGGFDPRHPDFDAAQASDYWHSLEQTYDLADQLIGAVMAAAGDDAVVMVVGDHGHQPYRWTFYPSNLLAEQGLLHVEWDEKLGRMAVDSEQDKSLRVWTSAYCHQSKRAAYHRALFHLRSMKNCANRSLISSMM